MLPASSALFKKKKIIRNSTEFPFLLIFLVARGREDEEEHKKTQLVKSDLDLLMEILCGTCHDPTDTRTSRALFPASFKCHTKTKH